MGWLPCSLSQRSGVSDSVVFVLKGFFMVAPNEAKVLQLFGSYMGTAKVAGLRWANPFFNKTKISLRVRNFESSQLKVNDHGWQSDRDRRRRGVAGRRNGGSDIRGGRLRELRQGAERGGAPQRCHELSLRLTRGSVVSLRGSTAAVADHLKKEVQQRLEKAGVEVLEARFSHMAYSQEIAAAMLQRQQAGAIIAARQLIVEGAVGMVEMALEQLSHKGIVHLDEERKAAMVSNLLVVLCGEKAAQPILNTGTIHQ